MWDFYNKVSEVLNAETLRSYNYKKDTRRTELKKKITLLKEMLSKIEALENNIDCKISDALILIKQSTEHYPAKMVNIWRNAVKSYLKDGYFDTIHVEDLLTTPRSRFYEKPSLTKNANDSLFTNPHIFPNLSQLKAILIHAIEIMTKNSTDSNSCDRALYYFLSQSNSYLYQLDTLKKIGDEDPETKNAVLTTLSDPLYSEKYNRSVGFITRQIPRAGVDYGKKQVDMFDYVINVVLTFDNLVFLKSVERFTAPAITSAAQATANTLIKKRDRNTFEDEGTTTPQSK